MTPFPLLARNALIVAPHPDDEAIGAFGLMTMLRHRRASIWVLVVSDGAASHPGSASWPPTRLIPERRRETRRAMAMLGVPPARIRFLGLPDGALTEVPLRRRVARAFCRIPAPDLIVGPVDDDAHADHRAVAVALRGCGRARRLGYRIWPAGSGRTGRLRLPLDPRTRAAKRRCVMSYRTQAGRITDSPTGMTITPRHLAAFARPTEHFRVLA